MALPSETAVLTPTTFSSGGTAPLFFHALSRGTSALQCGHQWARNTSIVGLPSPGTTSTAVPLNVWPFNVGAVVRATETDFTVVECFDPDNNQCRLSSHCRLQSVLGQAIKSFFAVLDNLTLEDLMVPPPSASQAMSSDGYVPLVPGLPRALGS